MLDLPILSVLSRTFRSLIQGVVRHIRRLSSERQAGQILGEQSIDQMESILDDTMDRLRGENIDDSWWKKILNKIHQSYIAPDFLLESELQEWLNEDRVANDLKALAKTRIMGGRQNDSELRTRLVQSYSDRTGEVSHLATQTIDVIVAILSAGYVVSIPAEQRTLAGIVQNLPGHIDQRIDRLKKEISARGSDAITEQSHTEHAKQELSKICTLRVFNPSESQQDIQELIQRIRNGDLSATRTSIKAEILFWGARLCALDKQTLALAQRFRDELKQIEPDKDLSIVEALLLEAKGDLDNALRILRDREDSDSRAIIFSMLVRSRGKQHALTWFDKQEGKGNREFFTAVGWWHLAVSLSKVGKWKEAADRLIQMETLWSDAPALAFIEGVINSAMLLPREFREIALTTIPVCPWITSISGEEAKRYHARALTCFKDSEESLKKIAGSELVQFINDWYLWIRLMGADNNAVTVARREIQQDMQDGKRAVSLMPFAWAFKIHFNVEPLQEHLAKQQQLSGLNVYEQLAEFLLLEQSMTPREVVSYLQQYRERLAEVISLANITSWLVEALVKDDQTEKARSLLEEQAVSLGEDVSDRLTVLIDTYEGIDTRSQLESLYSKTGKWLDLKNLISYLKEADDQVALLPLLKEMFKYQKTVENARDVVECLSDSPHFDYEEIILFLNAHSDIVNQSDDLNSAKARALFQIGEYQKSKEINDSFLARRNHHKDLALDINIAVGAGEWERFSAIVDREWKHRETHTPEILMYLAQLAAQEDQTADRALQLSRLAAEKASENPHILMAAYMMYCQLGKEDEAGPDWLARAAKLSSANEGPVWSVDLRHLINEWSPERRDHFQVTEKNLLDGDIPIGKAASVFNTPLISFFFQATHHNINESDGRRRTVLPITAGGRHPVELQEDWTIGLDITSIFVLSYLGLLKKAVDAFPHVKLAPETMGLLFHERNQVRFHQPSRIKAAEEIRDLVNLERIKSATDLSFSNQAIADEVGPNLAELLQAAKENGGRVVCVLPLHKVGSYLEKEANLGEYSDLIISTLDFCALLHREGKIDTDIHDHASVFLCARRQAKYASPSSSIFRHPIYLNALALSYLHDSGLLHPSAACGLDLRIHPSMLTENDRLIKASQLGTDLVNSIEEIRMILRNAVESETASFLPHISDDTEQTELRDIQLHTIFSLMQNSSNYNVLCVDDRFVNRFPIVAEATEQTTPIVCVLDILRQLVSRQIISATDNWTLRHKLRQGGYVLIPIEADELEYWLKTALFDDSGLKESTELRILRQTMARISSLRMIDAENETKFIIDLASACRIVIGNLWRDVSIIATRAIELTDWIWRYLMASAQAVQLADQEANVALLRALMINNLCQLLTSLVELPAERRASYADWIERSVFEPLRPANVDLIETAAETIINILKEQEGDKKNYGTLFLQCIPQSLYKIIWNSEPQLMSCFGHEMQDVINFGSDRQYVIQELYAAAKDVFLEKHKVVNVEDIDGREASITIDKENSHIVMEWSNEDSQPVQVRIPELTLLFPDRDVRVKTLQKMTEQFGPTAAPDLDSLLHEAEERELNYDEILSIFNEAANGVTTIQSRMVEKINRREVINIKDIVPQSLSYFEKFAGPLPGGQEPETYIREVLVPYRNRLLQQDLQRGLDICLLGALRDDLMPGEWVEDIDSDALWQALSSCHVESGPFSLIGALDIALYRQDDDRFKEFAEGAMIKLTNNKSGQTNGSDTYVLFALFTDLLLNRINFLKNGACQPGYWKRMCSWMQAGLITRSMANMNFENDLDSLREWAHKNMTLAGACRTLIDARWEPVFWSRNTSSESLHGEMVRRLISLKLRHGEAGRHIPKSDEIDRALMRIQERGIPFGTGPLEAHLSPSQPLPREISSTN